MFKGIKKLIAVLVIATGAWAQVWDGSSDTDWAGITDFTITTAAQLAGLAELVNEGNDFAGRTITLGADIMLNDTTNWQDWGTTPPANEWTAIGNYNEPDYFSFKGTFDGAGFIVSGVYIKSSNDDFRGLFGIGFEAIIKNLGVVASYVEAGMSVGVLAGANDEGTIENCYATGNVYGNNFAGGLVGADWGTITNSYATGEVKVDNSGGGGLVGVVYGTIENSYATGNVTGGNEVGGLVGAIYDGTIENSYATGNVTGGNKVGGLVGENSSTITNSYYDSETSGQSDDDGRGEPKTTAEMKLQATYDDWDFADIWGINSAINGGYPHLLSLVEVKPPTCGEGEHLEGDVCVPTPIFPLQLASGNKAVQIHNGLSLTAASNATVEIYGLSGNLVSRQSFSSGVYAISLGHLPKGMYIVKATFGSEKQVLRMPIR